MMPTMISVDEVLERILKHFKPLEPEKANILDALEWKGQSSTSFRRRLAERFKKSRRGRRGNWSCLRARLSVFDLDDVEGIVNLLEERFLKDEG